MRLKAETSLLLMVDFQAGLLPVIDGGNQVIAEASWLGGIANALSVPVWLTEQNPERLGTTEPSLLEALHDYRVWQKSHFGVMEEETFGEALAVTGRHQVVLCGTEAHICVMQTGLGLLERGYELYWLTEATASRREAEAKLARERVCQAGAVAVSSDMVAYEWLHRCDSEAFKRIHRDFLKPRSPRPVRFF